MPVHQDGSTDEQLSYAHADTYICPSGHCTEVAINPNSADRRSDFHKRCRRVTCNQEAAQSDNYYGLPSVDWTGRCGLPVIRTSLLPELEAACLLGSEEAVQALIGAIGWENIVETKGSTSSS